jgi:transketolase
MKIDTDIQQRAINTIRFLSADAVQQANSGHPGLPMGAAAMAYTLFTRHLHHNPRNPKWPDRDRFVLSGGHGSMLLYSLLHLCGYDLPLDELKRFRQWGSKTPGHPEYGLTPGVETTTGPLGQGFSNGVGMAIAEAHLAAEFNTPAHTIVDHYTYGIVTDGDLMEGVASEAASLAGHLRLGKLIYLYDDNHISIDGSTDLAFTEDRAARFAAYGWHTIVLPDGNDVEAVDAAINAARADPRPSLIQCRTHIGYGAPTRQDTEKAHGEALGDEELNGAKQKLGWPLEPRFYIPEDVADYFHHMKKYWDEMELEWRGRFDKYKMADREKAADFERRFRSDPSTGSGPSLPAGWDSNLPTFEADPKGVATRVASGKTLNAIAERVPEFMGGSADLTTSNSSIIKSTTSFNKEDRSGRYFHFGVREHGMGGIVNGTWYHGGLRTFGATFLVFSDYMRGAIRLSALSHLPCIWIFTHDSIGLGEDGPTHQPIEHLAALRAMPNLTVIRPGDANETVQAWRVAMTRTHGPTALVLTRQSLPTLDRSIYTSAEGLQKGAYVLADMGDNEPELILMASGSEVSLIVEGAARLAAEGVSLRVVSFPSWELFSAQDQAYRESVLPGHITSRLAVEAAVSMGWERWVGDKGAVISMEQFGASAPGKVALENFGFTVDHVVAKARELLKK